MEKENVAVIDIGTNTFHLLLVEVGSSGDFTVKHKFKEMVKLGEGGIDHDEIAPPAFERGIRALKTFSQYIQQHACSRVLAFATSALRTAKNAKPFIDQAYSETGISIQVINGNEEAALIYEGVKNGIQLPTNEPVLIIDIGGGSVEFIVANHLHPLLLRSLKLGASRVYETFKPSDPITPEQQKRILHFYQNEMQTLIQEIKEFPIRKVIGTSGAFETLATMIAHHKADTLTATSNINGYQFTKKDFQEIAHKILTLPREERVLLPGMDKQRVDLMPVATLLIDLLQQKISFDTFMACTYALKDGIFFTHLGTKVHGLGAANDKDNSLRKKSVKNLCKKFQCQEQHTQKVLQIATVLFEQTKQLHWYGELEKELLTYAAMLHDVGYFIHRSGHHKHGQYIILNAQLPGFSNDELLIISNIVRYHRKSLPNKEHPYFNILSPEHKTLVKKLAALLRIADHLDKGHRDLVKDVKVQCFPQNVLIQVLAEQDISPEIEAAIKEKQLFEDAFKVTLQIQPLSIPVPTK